MNSLSALGSNAKPLSFEGTAVAKHASLMADGSQGLDWFSMMPNVLASAQSNGASFASLFSGATNASGTAADPLAQLSALLQSGTPMSTIIDRLAQKLASAVQQQLPSQTGASTSARLKTSLVDSIANALAPPGNAPPGTAAEQAAALAQRLRKMIATIAGDTKNTAGQQNDIAGKILDANSAKDIPAQRKSESASTQVDADAIARALLGSVVNSSGSANVPSSASAASTGQSVQTGAPPTQITQANAPDLLARMLVRAAGVDARVNGTAAQSGQLSAPVGTDSTPSALAARFQNALAALAHASDSNTQGNSSGSNAERDLSQQPDSKPSSSTDATQLGIAAAANTQTSNASFTTQVQAHAQSAVDANAVVEQVVKSMVMRTNQSGSSEIRLRLNPDNLGEVTMKITVSGSSISANMVAANGDVRNALLSNHQHLAQSLNEAGLTLTGFSVDVSGGDAGRDQNRDRTGGFGRRYVVHEIGGSEVGSDAAQTSSTGPQLLPSSSLELFNYLA